MYKSGYQNPYKDCKKRHEIKILLSYAQYMELRARVHGILTPDPHMTHPDGYTIRSVYLDDCLNSAYHEKDIGVAHRNKFRIRSYNNDDSLILLENKEKIDDRINKTSAKISRETYDAILRGDFTPLLAYEHPLCRQVYALNRAQGLSPRILVSYEREAYVHPLSMVRITFDKAVTVGLNTYDMFASELFEQTVFSHQEVVLEIKYEEHFPMYIRQLLQNNGQKTAVSKFVLCCDKRKAQNLVV